jgi:hypothetical protein
MPVAQLQLPIMMPLPTGMVDMRMMGRVEPPPMHAAIPPPVELPGENLHNVPPPRRMQRSGGGAFFGVDVFPKYFGCRT